MSLLKSKFISIYSKYMVAIGVFGQFLFYVQAYEIVRYHKTEGVSITAFLISLFSLANWLIYGVVIKDRALIMANLAGVLGALFVVISLIIYK